MRKRAILLHAFALQPQQHPTISLANLINSINFLLLARISDSTYTLPQHEYETHFTRAWNKNKRRNHNWLDSMRQYKRKDTGKKVGLAHKETDNTNPTLSVIRALNFLEAILFPIGLIQYSLRYSLQMQSQKTKNKILIMLTHKITKSYFARTIHEWIFLNFMNETGVERSGKNSSFSQWTRKNNDRNCLKYCMLNLHVHEFIGVGWKKNNIALRSFNGNTPSLTASSCMLSSYCF